MLNLMIVLVIVLSVTTGSARNWWIIPVGMLIWGENKYICRYIYSDSVDSDCNCADHFGFCGGLSWI